MTLAEFQLRLFFLSSFYTTLEPGEWKEVFSELPSEKIQVGIGQTSEKHCIANSAFYIEDGDELKVLDRKDEHKVIIDQKIRARAIVEIAILIPEIYEALGITQPLSDWEITFSRTLSSPPDLFSGLLGNRDLRGKYVNRHKNCLIQSISIMRSKTPTEATMSIQFFNETERHFISFLLKTFQDNDVDILFDHPDLPTFNIILSKTPESKIVKTFNFVLEVPNAFEPISPDIFKEIKNMTLSMHDIYLERINELLDEGEFVELVRIVVDGMKYSQKDLLTDLMNLNLEAKDWQELSLDTKKEILNSLLNFKFSEKLFCIESASDEQMKFLSNLFTKDLNLAGNPDTSVLKQEHLKLKQNDATLTFKKQSDQSQLNRDGAPSPQQ